MKLKNTKKKQKQANSFVSALWNRLTLLFGLVLDVSLNQDRLFTVSSAFLSTTPTIASPCIGHTASYLRTKAYSSSAEKQIWVIILQPNKHELTNTCFKEWSSCQCPDCVSKNQGGNLWTSFSGTCITEVTWRTRTLTLFCRLYKKQTEWACQ